MDQKKILRLINMEEGPKLDFKLRLDIFTEGGKKEFAKDVCAIANSKGGRGYIIVGVMDKSKEIIGIEDEDRYGEERIQQIVTTRCEPPIPIEVEFATISGKRVGVIIIYDGDQKPYQIKETGAFYIRRGSTTDVMRKQEILRIFEENLELAIETCPIIKSNKSLLDKSLINKYFAKKGIIVTEQNEDFLLESSGITYMDKITGKVKCTFGGLLVFSEKNSICIANNIIRIINKVNKNTNEVMVIQGSLLSMIETAKDKINEIINTNYPKEAVLEAVKNAVLYREYTNCNRIIEVIITKRSVVIESPGELIQNFNVGIYNYLRRNMWIYEKLITLDDNNNFLNNEGGFSRIKSAFKGKGKVKFINSQLENSFKVILPGIY